MDKTRGLLSLIESARKSNENRSDIGRLLVQRDLLRLELAIKALPKKVSRKGVMGRPRSAVEEKVRELLKANPNLTTKEVISQCSEVSPKTVRRYLKQLQFT